MIGHSEQSEESLASSVLPEFGRDSSPKPMADAKSVLRPYIPSSHGVVHPMSTDFASAIAKASKWTDYGLPATPFFASSVEAQQRAAIFTLLGEFEVFKRQGVELARVNLDNDFAGFGQPARLLIDLQ